MPVEHQAQSSLFDATFGPRPAKPAAAAHPNAQDQANARRLRTLMLTTPLVALEANKLRHGPSWVAYDLRTLQLHAIQVVVENMGMLEGGITQVGVIAALSQLARAMAPAADPAELAEVSQVVLDWLLNAEDRDEFRPFYVLIGPDGAPIRRQTTIEILRERQEPDGTLVLRASVEAINLLLGPLSEDIADAQRAEERLLDDYIAAGRFDAAVDQARRAQIRSIQYAEQVSRWLNNARQDIARLDWSGAVKDEMDAALSHIGSRLLDEDRMRERAEATAREVANSDNLDAVVRVIRDIQDCHSRHTHLHGLLLDAGPIFRREQERQRLARPVGLKAIALARELDRALELPLTRNPDATPAGAFFRALSGPASPPLLDVVRLVAQLNAPPRESGIFAPEIPETSLVEVGEPVRFPSEVRQVAESVLATALAGPRRLSALLREVRERAPATPALAAELIRLLALEAFASESRGRAGDPDQPRGELVGERLEDEAYRGDDLVLGPRSRWPEEDEPNDRDGAVEATEGGLSALPATTVALVDAVDAGIAADIRAEAGSEIEVGIEIGSEIEKERARWN